MENVKYTALNYEEYERYLLKDEYTCQKFFFERLNGIFVMEDYSYRFKFENNYGASVIKNRGSYGNEADLFELALTYNDELSSNGDLIGDTLFGCLTNEDVIELLEKIKNLK